jgi:hypothetical protein
MDTEKWDAQIDPSNRGECAARMLCEQLRVIRANTAKRATKVTPPEKFCLRSMATGMNWKLVI